jgi:hypothetical protein
VLPVLAMDAPRHSGEEGEELDIERSQGMRVHDIGPEAQQPRPQPHVRPEVFAGTLMERKYLYRSVADTGLEAGAFGEADEDVMETFAGDSVDQVDDPVFHTTGSQLIENMHDGWNRAAGVQLQANSSL